MSSAVHVLAQVAFVGLLIGLPALYLVYSDRFRQFPEPREFAILFGVVLIAAVLMSIPALAVVAATALLSIGLARLTAGSGLSGLTYTQELIPSRLFPGDEAELVVRLENRKLLPLGWLHVVDTIHFRSVRNDHRLADVLGFSGGVERTGTNQFSLVIDAALGPYGSLTRRYRIKALRRGVYTLGPATASSGDPFGMFQTEGTLGEPLEIVVYPNVYTPGEPGMPFRDAMGELIPQRALLEDPTLLAGSREYRPGDPLHKMHWKATARSGELQVRVCDPSTTANLLILLNINTYDYLWEGINVERMEAAIDAAASLAVWGLEKGYAVGLNANGSAMGQEGWTRILPSAHLSQTAAILDRLARISAASRYPAQDLLSDESLRLDARTSVLFVTPVISPPTIPILTGRRLRDRVAIVYVGDVAPPAVPGVPIHHLFPRVVRAAS
ncbi:MAG TPA: DUF58 domain-containing protein [Chloroflexota bacterium]|nr:DUF58 domain-containing protein [Chloroflexota bacterium]